MTFFEGFKQLRPEDRQLVLRLMSLFSMAALLIVLIPATIAGLAYRQYTNNRIEDNKAAIARERAIREEINRSLLALNSEQCIKLENTQAVIVNLLLYAQKSTPTSTIQHAIDALEPPDENDCPLPPEKNP